MRAMQYFVTANTTKCMYCFLKSMFVANVESISSDALDFEEFSG